jgi:hypothetical protein
VNAPATKLAEALLADERGAVFSYDRVYRYRLWQVWDQRLPRLLYVMLNPSTADEVQNDPTVERCYRRAVRLGYGAFEVVNIFALRSTDPNGLYRHNFPIGEREKPQIHPDGEANNTAICNALAAAQAVICGWGEHGAHLGRGQEVLRLLRAEVQMRLRSGLSAASINALKINKSGEPQHPLYIGYDVQPFEI